MPKYIFNNLHVLKQCDLLFLALINDPVMCLAEAIKLTARYLVWGIDKQLVGIKRLSVTSIFPTSIFLLTKLHKSFNSRFQNLSVKFQLLTILYPKFVFCCSGLSKPDPRVNKFLFPAVASPPKMPLSFHRLGPYFGLFNLSKILCPLTPPFYPTRQFPLGFTSFLLSFRSHLNRFYFILKLKCQGSLLSRAFSKVLYLILHLQLCILFLKEGSQII